MTARVRNMTSARTFRADSDALYLVDNDAVLCGAHLGMTARATGRDISGRTIHRVTQSDVTYAALIDFALECETCGKQYGDAARFAAHIAKITTATDAEREALVVEAPPLVRARIGR